MKGIIISFALFGLYAIVTTSLSHIIKPKRHGKLFFGSALAWSPVFFLSYKLLPTDLGFLPLPWQAGLPWADMTYGYILFLLNCHNYIDFFFGFNGGFSTSVMLAIHQAGPNGLSVEDLLASYENPDGSNTIHDWRIPRLAETGYITIAGDSSCRLTKKGKLVSTVVRVLKKFLNVGQGG